jgi:hypothetical protein
MPESRLQRTRAAYHHGLCQASRSDVGGQAIDEMEDTLPPAKLYFGDYTLVRCIVSQQCYRWRGAQPPSGYLTVDHVYDRDGFLLRDYWSLPRVPE